MLGAFSRCFSGSRAHVLDAFPKNGTLLVGMPGQFCGSGCNVSVLHRVQLFGLAGVGSLFQGRGGFFRAPAQVEAGVSRKGRW